MLGVLVILFWIVIAAMFGLKAALMAFFFVLILAVLADKL